MPFLAFSIIFMLGIFPGPYTIYSSTFKGFYDWISWILHLHLWTMCVHMYIWCGHVCDMCMYVGYGKDLISVLLSVLDRTDAALTGIILSPWTVLALLPCTHFFICQLSFLAIDPIPLIYPLIFATLFKNSLLSETV